MKSDQDRIHDYNAIGEYWAAQKKLGEIRITVSKAKDLQRQKLNECHSKWNTRISTLKNKIWELEQKAKKETAHIKETHQKAEEKMDRERAPHTQVVNDMKRIFLLFEIIEQDKREVIMPATADVELVDTEFFKVGLSFRKNSNPRNKITLSVVSNSLFQYKFSETRVAIGSKAGPHRDTLMQWWGNGVKLKPYLDTHNQLLKELAEARELYKQKEWKRAYLLHEKLYYEISVSQGIETSAYKAILERLQILSIVDEDLPLLVGKVVTEDGMKDLETRLKGN